MTIGGIEQAGAAMAALGRWRQGWWVVPTLSTAVLAGLVAWTASFPGIPFSGLGLTLLAGLTTLALWSVGAGRVTGRNRILAAIVSALLLTASIAATAAGLPLRVAFGASRSAFETIAAQADARLPDFEGPDASGEGFPVKCPSQIGLYGISDCQVTDHGGLVFVQTQNALTDDSGFAYVPNAAARADLANSYPHHLIGPWFRWTCGC